MPFAGRYEYRMVRFRCPYIIKVFLAVAHHHFGLTLFDTQELVDIGMQFEPHLAADRNGHERHLKIGSRPQCRSEIFVSKRIGFDIEYRRLCAIVFQLNHGFRFDCCRSGRFIPLCLGCPSAAGCTCRNSDGEQSCLKKIPIHNSSGN